MLLVVVVVVGLFEASTGALGEAHCGGWSFESVSQTTRRLLRDGHGSSMVFKVAMRATTRRRRRRRTVHARRRSSILRRWWSAIRRRSRRWKAMRRTAQHHWTLRSPGRTMRRAPRLASVVARRSGAGARTIPRGRWRLNTIVARLIMTPPVSRDLLNNRLRMGLLQMGRSITNLLQRRRGVLLGLGLSLFLPPPCLVALFVLTFDTPPVLPFPVRLLLGRARRGIGIAGRGIAATASARVGLLARR